MFGICLLIFIGLCIYHASEKELPAGYHNNWRLEAHDSQLVREGKMTQRQFLKNMDNGKYRQECDKMGLLIFIGITWLIIDIIKEASEPTISADHWNHAFDRDEFGVSNCQKDKDFVKNLRNGKYK